MESSLRESDRLQVELQQLTRAVQERRSENEKLQQENLSLRDELHDRKLQGDRYIKYISYAIILHSLFFCMHLYNFGVVPTIEAEKPPHEIRKSIENRFYGKVLLSL